MAGTTAAAFKAALKSSLMAYGPLSGIQVVYGQDVEARKTGCIRLGAVEDAGVAPTGLKAGRRRREEDYVLHVIVEVIGTAGGPEANEARAVTLGTAVEEFLADNPALSGSVPGLLFAVVSGFSMETSETTDGARTVLDYSVSVKGRLL